MPRWQSMSTPGVKIGRLNPAKGLKLTKELKEGFWIWGNTEVLLRWQNGAPFYNVRAQGSSNTKVNSSDILLYDDSLDELKRLILLKELAEGHLKNPNLPGY
ncbi:uncharacterized protein DSM5745_02632 [Aspergillus mulundensis]|uniref:Uncharacterized protein n=1 Tax=Aspergillus mulundensis TaxID=1810919 RepID=A0A3D8SX04_9EURO|nr:hypothetical protein DSM5745_02632 [Aspergillus mulundensis]RDW90857.1 hypothetical protein DSM5745_02632 [Aspergillus mulundensis]